MKSSDLISYLAIVVSILSMVINAIILLVLK